MNRTLTRCDTQRACRNYADIRVPRDIDLHSASRITGRILAGYDSEVEILGIRRRTGYGVGDRTKDVAAPGANERQEEDRSSPTHHCH